MVNKTPKLQTIAYKCAAFFHCLLMTPLIHTKLLGTFIGYLLVFIYWGNYVSSILNIPPSPSASARNEQESASAPETPRTSSTENLTTEGNGNDSSRADPQTPPRLWVPCFSSGKTYIFSFFSVAGDVEERKWLHCCPLWISCRLDLLRFWRAIRISCRTTPKWPQR